MVDRRKKDVAWWVADDNGQTSLMQAQLAVLMDVRDELKKLNGLLHCPNFQNIPRKLDASCH